MAAACALGVAAALLVSCGSSGKGLIPSANATPLQGDFQEVSQAAQSGNCPETEAKIAKTEQDFNALPGSVDNGLRSTLRQGIGNLRTRALVLCSQPLSSTSTTATTTKTATTPTTTTTTPTTTTTTPTTPTQTTPTTPTQTTPGPGGGTPAPGSEAPAGGAGPTGEGGSGGNGNGGAGAGGQEGVK